MAEEVVVVGERVAARRDPRAGCSGRGGSDRFLGQGTTAPVVSDVLTGCLSRFRGLGILNATATAMAMSFSTADISIQLLMDTMNALQEIESRVTARAFAAVMDPTKGPEVRDVLAQLLAVLDETSSDGLI